MFGIIGFIEFIDRYSHILYLDKTKLTCKKCHRNLSLIKTCRHSTHSLFLPLFMAVMFASLTPFAIYHVIPWAESQPPVSNIWEPYDPDPNTKPPFMIQLLINGSKIHPYLYSFVSDFGKIENYTPSYLTNRSYNYYEETRDEDQEWIDYMTDFDLIPPRLYNHT